MSLSLVFPCAPLHAAASCVQRAFARGVRPLSIEEGTGGVYICRSPHHRFVGIFKPSDEEPAAPFNPKEHFASIVRRGIPAGGMAVRECMAYIADEDHFAQVPPTTLAMASHDAFSSNHMKRGSFQAYCAHDCSAEDIGPSFFNVDQVHAIACLDIRLVNQDRHTGNFLVQRRQNHQLIPIDHGCCLPDYDHMEETTFAWMQWPQAKVPLSATTKAYVASLDSFAQEKRMEALRPPKKALVTLHLGTIMLKKGISMGLTLFEIGQLMTRPLLSPATPSPLEDLIRQLAHLNPDSHLLPFLHAFEIALVKLIRRTFPQHQVVSPSPKPVKWSYATRKSYAKVLLSTAA